MIAAVGESLPFRDNSFDVIISLEVLEHVEQPAAVPREVYRILRPGGWFYLSCPNYLSFREVHYDVAWLPLLPKPLGPCTFGFVGDLQNSYGPPLRM